MFDALPAMLGLFLALLGALELGRFLGRRRREAEVEERGRTAADGVVLALLGLMVAFTFTHTTARFDERRELIVRQANAFGTAWLRLDTLPPADREHVREPMRRWLTIAENLSAYAGDKQRFGEAIDEAERAHEDAWRRAVAVTAQQEAATRSFVLAPLNEWIDLTTERLAMDQLGLPPMVLPTLVVLALLASLLVGFGFAHRRSLLHATVFAGAVAFSVYIILDLSEPRAGLIRVDAMDRVMRELRTSLEGRAAGATTGADMSDADAER